MNINMKICNDLKIGKSLNQICTEYQISFKDLFKITKRYHRRPFNGLPEHIIHKGSRYIIQRDKNNQRNYYGSFLTLEDAIIVRDKLVENEWDLPASEYLGMAYITKYKKKWRILKTINHKTKDIGLYNSLEDAILVRNMLVEFDWDLDYLPLILKQTGVERYGN